MPLSLPFARAIADRYRMERELGAGGLSTVYLTEDLEHHRRVAVKVLRRDTFDDPDRPGPLRIHYAIVNGRVYTRIMPHRSVLGIAKLAAR